MSVLLHRALPGNKRRFLPRLAFFEKRFRQKMKDTYPALVGDQSWSSSEVRASERFIWPPKFGGIHGDTIKMISFKKQLSNIMHTIDLPAVCKQLQ
jgi:hypothetical protein